MYEEATWLGRLPLIISGLVGFEPRRFSPQRTLYSGNGNAGILAANITGPVEDGNQTNNMNVILVADADVLADPL